MPVPTRWSWQETHAEVDAKGGRIAHGTLADADTPIEELYAWEFDGPFLRDFAGSKPTGPCRAAGAIGRTP